MFGVVLIGVAQLFAEVSTSLGKYEIERKHESVYRMGFLHAFWATFFLIGIAIYTGNWIFSLASLPTFTARVILEIVLAIVNVHAVVSADRSTFAFLRTLTIPLLLAVDVALGYSISLAQMAGISAMVVGFTLLTLNHGLSRTGKILSLFSALIPVGTLTLYKYNITHFNSVEAEQAILHVVLVAALVIVAWVRTGENLFTHLFRPSYVLQSVAAGIATVLLSYAYLYAPASIITAGKRGFEILGAIAFGRAVFKEKHVLIKFVSCAIIVGGIVLILF
ncbi:MAG TPA: hypothetical protein VNM40_01970 [Candidatus Paceibacterota bacterium]|nr:hypothetical protein [Candidatus Paceibacterota bacterium]